jgi:Putative metallopeptidase
MLNYFKLLSGLALASLFTVAELPGVFPQTVAQAQTTGSVAATKKTSNLIARNRRSGRIKVVYGKTNDPLSAALMEGYQRYGLFEEIGKLITSEINLPRDITVVVTDCGQANAFYNSEKHAIVMCNELIKSNYQVLLNNGYEEEEALQTAIFASVFTFYHESAHMLISELNLPVVGRDEDAADQFAAFFLLINDSSKGKSISGEIVMAAAKLFALQSTPVTPEDTINEHALNQQRFYSLVCILYGAAPEKYSGLVAKLGYSESRLNRCQADAVSIVTAWQRLLAPYLKT